MSLRIGKYMRMALADNEALSEAKGGRIYPVVAPLEKPEGFPYVVFAMSELSEADTKDGFAFDTVNEEVVVFAKTVDSLESTAQLVREAMVEAFPKWRENPDGFQIADQTFSAGAEDFSLEHDGYFVRLLYTIETSPIEETNN